VVWPAAAVGGAMLTGMREAVRTLHVLAGADDVIADAAAAQVESDSIRKRKKVWYSALLPQSNSRSERVRGSVVGLEFH